MLAVIASKYLKQSYSCLYQHHNQRCIFLVSSRFVRVTFFLSNSHEINKPLRLAIPFWVSPDGVLEDGLLLAYEPVPVKSSVIPSGLCLTDSEGNPGDMFATLGFLDGREFPRKQTISRCSINCDSMNIILGFQVTSSLYKINNKYHSCFRFSFIRGFKTLY